MRSTRAVGYWNWYLFNRLFAILSPSSCLISLIMLRTTYVNRSNWVRHMSHLLIRYGGSSRATTVPPLIATFRLLLSSKWSNTGNELDTHK